MRQPAHDRYHYEEPPRRGGWFWWVLGCGGLGLVGLLVVLCVAVIIVATPSETSEQPQLFGIGQNVVVREVRWKVLSARDRGALLRKEESRYPWAAEDKQTRGKFVEIKVEVENLSKDMKIVANPTIVDDQGREFFAASDVSEWIPENEDLFLSESLIPNIPYIFVSIFEVPTNAKGLKFVASDLGLLAPEKQTINLGF